MSVWPGRIFSYIIALSFVTLVGVYLLDIPTVISGEPLLVKEYYYDNGISSFILDVFLVAIYISIAMHLASNSDHVQQVATVAISSAMISTIFMLLFNNGFAQGSFFSRWFNKVGMKAVIYDVGLVSSVYITMVAVHKILGFN